MDVPHSIAVIALLISLGLAGLFVIANRWRERREDRMEQRLARTDEVAQARERYLADLFAAQNRTLIETAQALITRNQDTMAATVEKVLTEQRFAIQRMFPEFARPILSEEDQKTLREMQTGDLWRDKREGMNLEELEAHYAAQGNPTS